MFFAEVILPLALPKTFTYKVSEAEFAFLTKGMRVAVPFGRNKIYTALVAHLHREKPQLYEARDIDQILDEVPVVTEVQLAHWFWVASYYMCSIGEVYRSAMPTGLLLESETTIYLNQTDEAVDTAELSDEEFLIFEALHKQSSLKLREVSGILNKKKVFPVVQQLLARDIILVREEVVETYKPKKKRYIRLKAEFDDPQGLRPLLEELGRAVKQKELLLAFFQLKAKEKNKPVSVKALLEYSGAAQGALKSLIDREIFEEYFISEDRNHFSGDARQDQMLLSEAQQTAVEAIGTLFAEKDVCLLQGVTASGKTEMYFRLMEEYLASGKQVLYLVPEIALTTQLVSRLRFHFGEKVAVFHSGFTNNERVEVWHKVLQDNPKAQVVIGTRSVLFLPFCELGLIIVDEEHEQTFKQYEPAPRYHARDTAIVLAKFHGAKTLLGSATPSLESRYNAESGKYGLVEISERYGGFCLPEIELVDLKDKYFRKKMSGHFSDTLIERITETLERGEQVILFQNRRGFSPMVECTDCGHTPQCPQCDVSLTYHKNKGQLRCHYCGHTIAMPLNCHACKSVNLTTKGFGTEQVQEEIAMLFPAAKVARMDQDTTRGKHAFERIIERFAAREIDVLAGTQMLSKGLDFDNVGLVGVMNADNMLHYPDFRAQERAFQMLVQVAGRAGRSEKKGTVLIQTYSPYHNIIRQVTTNDYASMYVEQLHERRIYKYPPFFRVIRITLKYRDYERLKQAANWLGEALRQHLEVPVLGPEEPGINRIRNEYIRTLLVKLPQQSQQSALKNRIQKIRNSFEAVPQFRVVKLTVNVDFY